MDLARDYYGTFTIAEYFDNLPELDHWIEQIFSHIQIQLTDEEPTTFKFRRYKSEGGKNNTCSTCLILELFNHEYIEDGSVLVKMYSKE
jgi:hypothetical protein